MSNPVTSILDLLANLFGFARKRQELVNAPEMQAAAKGQTDQDIKDKAAKAVATKDTKTVQKLISCLVICAALAISGPGCRTVTPAPVAATEASFGDDGRQNSGFLGWVEGGALIDAGARDRYNALIKIYGAEFLPRLKKDHGIERRDGRYFIANDALQKFIIMSEWRRMGRAPKD